MSVGRAGPGNDLTVGCTGPGTWGSGPWTWDLGLWTLDPGTWTLDPGPWTLDLGPSMIWFRIPGGWTVG